MRKRRMIGAAVSALILTAVAFVGPGRAGQAGGETANGAVSANGAVTAAEGVTVPDGNSRDTSIALVGSLPELSPEESTTEKDSAKDPTEESMPDGELPVTGAGTMIMGGIGVLMFATGAGLLLFVLRRSTYETGSRAGRRPRPVAARDRRTARR